MFEIGKYYDFTTLHDQEYFNFRGQVLEWQHPVVKYESDAGKVTILNTSSPQFFSAELGPSPEEILAAERAFLSSAHSEDFD